MRIKELLVVMLLAIAQLAMGQGRLYSFAECEGSMMPYQAPEERVAAPDSLRLVMVNHVGRHGARYPSSAKDCRHLSEALHRADSLGTLTPLGRQLLLTVEEIERLSSGQWGALDSLGMAEERGIAERLYKAFPELMQEARVEALSSYVPRCMMSMYSFTHQLDRESTDIEFATKTGRCNDALLRPFEVDSVYVAWKKGETLGRALTVVENELCPTSAIERALGEDYPFGDDRHRRKLAMEEYNVVRSLSAMGLPSQMSTFFTLEEVNGLWRVSNLDHYLTRTASSLSSLPAEIAAPLLRALVLTTDSLLSHESGIDARLRFGHAETLMPLLSLMQLPGCYYVADDYLTVDEHWRDFAVVPLGANLQMLLFEAPSGAIYLRVDLNERPTPLAADWPLYLPWTAAHDHLLKLCE
ncbi:MAG: histidine-type phosphatase [Bacteroidales bacterium]|nr:histidine-type phosphatase [Bacteroidales bacterium]